MFDFKGDFNDEEILNIDAADRLYVESAIQSQTEWCNRLIKDAKSGIELGYSSLLVTSLIAMKFLEDEKNFPRDRVVELLSCVIVHCAEREIKSEQD